MANPSDFFVSVPKIRPMLNVGSLFDVQSGSYQVGEHGEHILNGGYPHFLGICGRANTYKTTVMNHFNLSATERYGDVFNKAGQQSVCLVYDSESSLTPARIEHLGNFYPGLKGWDVEETGAVLVTDNNGMSGNHYFHQIKEFAKAKVKDKKAILTTPFIGKDGKHLTMLRPTMAGIDSISNMNIDSVDAIYDKNQIGDSKMNMEAARVGAAKSQMVIQIPKLVSSSGFYMTMTAHLGDEILDDPYAPSKKKLQFLKQGTKLKRCPENFTFLTNILYNCMSATPLQNKADKTPLFPRDSDDRTPGDMDLQLITIQVLRSKSGATGLPFEIIASQRDGLHMGLSEFRYIKERKFGLDGNDLKYALSIYPDRLLQRTTVRGLIDNDPKLKRALEITCELCMISQLWKGMGDIVLEPEYLFKAINDLGVSWDVILGDTRGYWLPKELEEHEDKYFLSTIDLCLLARKQYYPYWWDDYCKSKGMENTLKKQFA
tara:strand:- start:6788 stop:8254 length:1467 start_codon:yes stop_codon:yes gene_type:complete